MYFLHAINSDRQTRILNVLGQIAMILGDKKILSYLIRQISPTTGPRCPEGSRKLRFPDYVTAAHEDGKVVSLTHRPPLPPGNAPGTHFC